MANFNPAGFKQPKSKYGASTTKFVPKYPEKYIGTDINNIISRSSWEKDFMHTCDENPAIMQWAAEPFSIPYMDPVTQKKRNYWPDFIISYMKKDGTMMHEVIEIKPIKEALLEKSKSKRDRIQLATNQAKWQAANAFCKQNGLTFKILTEEQMYRR